MCLLRYVITFLSSVRLYSFDLIFSYSKKRKKLIILLTKCVWWLLTGTSTYITKSFYVSPEFKSKTNFINIGDTILHGVCHSGIFFIFCFVCHHKMNMVWTWELKKIFSLCFICYGKEPLIWYVHQIGCPDLHLILWSVHTFIFNKTQFI